MTAVEFARDARLTEKSNIFVYRNGKVIVGCDTVIAILSLTLYPNVDIKTLPVAIFSKEDLELAESSKPRKLTGKKWTEDSKNRLNAEFAKYPKLPKGLFSINDIRLILDERKRLHSLEPCVTVSYLADLAHYHKGMSWKRAMSYANYQSCNCCEQ